MKRRNFIKTTALAAAAAGTASLYSLTAASRRPNVIVILSEGQGCGDFSFYGNPILKTPHMDRLATESVRLTDFHVTPAATPTYSQLMTGLSCLRNLACDDSAGRTVTRRNVPMMAELFRKGGYATGLFGPWKLGGAWPDRPMDKGFDQCIRLEGYGLSSALEYDNDSIHPRYWDGLQEKQSSVYCTDLWFGEAIHWMTQQKQKGKPFFTYIPVAEIPQSFPPPEKFAGVYKDKTDPETAAFFAVLASLDENVGKLEEWLQTNGLHKNTIVVFLTAHGGSAGLKVHTAGLRDGQGSYYEGGHRVPCFIRWPEGGLGAGLEIKMTTQVQDILPTLLELAELPAKKIRFDGTSLVPLFSKKNPTERAPIVVQYGQGHRPAKNDGIVAWNQWRLHKGKELYDIEKDRGEKTDVAAEFPDIVKRMTAYYDLWWSNLYTDMWRPTPLMVNSKMENPVLLSSIDWWEVYAGSSDAVAQAEGGPRGGLWTLQVEIPGNYSVELRRWPFHVNKPIVSEGPKTAIHGRPLAFEVKQIPAQTAVLKLNGNEQTAAVASDSVGVQFQCALNKGLNQLQGWFRDAEGADLCGAFYAQLTKI